MDDGEINLTQAQLARMAGMTKNHLSALERGIALARPEKLLEFSDILGVDFAISARGGTLVTDDAPSQKPAPQP